LQESAFYAYPALKRNGDSNQEPPTNLIGGERGTRTLDPGIMSATP
jgi:hypothetical protein